MEINTDIELTKTSDIILNDGSLNDINVKNQSCEANMEVMTVSTPKHIKEKIVDQPQNIISISEKTSDNYFNKCVILNYIIISASLLILSFILYNLTNEIRNLNTNKLSLEVEGLNAQVEGLNSNLNKISNISDILEAILKYIQNLPTKQLDNIPQLIQGINRSLINFEQLMRNYNMQYIEYTNFINSDVEFTNPENIDIPDEIMLQENMEDQTAIEPKPVENVEANAASFTQPDIGF